MKKLIKNTLEKLPEIILISTTTIILGIWFNATPIMAQNPKTCALDLKPQIDQIINQPRWNRARWGILIQKFNSSETIYERDSQTYYTPASTTKLLTTAAILQKLGPNYQIKTSIYDLGNNRYKLIGRGDPSLNITQLQTLAQKLKSQGITNISELIIDGGYFKGERLNGTWEMEDVIWYYGTSVNSLILNENYVKLIFQPQQIGQPLKLTWEDPNLTGGWELKNHSFTLGSGTNTSTDIYHDLGVPILRVAAKMSLDQAPVTERIAVRDPNQYFVDQVNRIWSNEGIRIEQIRLVFQGNSEGKEIESIGSLPLSQLIATINLDSNNLYAEALLRYLGSQNPNMNSDQSGLEITKKILSDLGVDPNSYIQADGSGMSRRNLISPQALVQVLRGMKNSPNWLAYQESLPITGIRGTLKNRLVNTPLERIILAKTGTMTGAVTLAGFVNSKEPLVFSIMVNNSDKPASMIRHGMDQILLLLVKLNEC